MSKPKRENGAGPNENEGTGEPDGKKPDKGAKSSSKVLGENLPGYGPQAADNQGKT